MKTVLANDKEEGLPVLQFHEANEYILPVHQTIVVKLVVRALKALGERLGHYTCFQIVAVMCFQVYFICILF